jgi:hypothetical protein
LKTAVDNLERRGGEEFQDGETILTWRLRETRVFDHDAFASHMHLRAVVVRSFMQADTLAADDLAWQSA